MREIKFRAWNKKLNEMREVSAICFDDQNIMVFGNKKDHEDAIKKGASISSGGFIYRNMQMEWKFDDIELIQFTGLKDKNGKEIYEGDILKVGKEMAIVIYEDASFWRQNSKDKECDELTNFVGSPKIEVIGNIFENPELINK